MELLVPTTPTHMLSCFSPRLPCLTRWHYHLPCCLVTVTSLPSDLPSSVSLSRSDTSQSVSLFLWDVYPRISVWFISHRLRLDINGPPQRGIPNHSSSYHPSIFFVVLTPHDVFWSICCFSLSLLDCKLHKDRTLLALPVMYLAHNKYLDEWMSE